MGARTVLSVDSCVCPAAFMVPRVATARSTLKLLHRIIALSSSPREGFDSARRSNPTPSESWTLGQSGVKDPAPTDLPVCTLETLRAPLPRARVPQAARERKFP